MVKVRWRWRRGKIDKGKEHFEILYGDINVQDTETWLPIALVSPPSARTFTVQFLVDLNDPRTRKESEAVRRELDFYLVELGEDKPWDYAKHHCTTAANVYSAVHWTYHPREHKNKSGR